MTSSCKGMATLASCCFSAGACAADLCHYGTPRPPLLRRPRPGQDPRSGPGPGCRLSLTHHKRHRPPAAGPPGKHLQGAEQHATYAFYSCPVMGGAGGKPFLCSNKTKATAPGSPGAWLSQRTGQEERGARTHESRVGQRSVNEDGDSLNAFLVNSEMHRLVNKQQGDGGSLVLKSGSLPQHPRLCPPAAGGPRFV
jgi:hypothetical protein